MLVGGDSSGRIGSSTIGSTAELWTLGVLITLDLVPETVEPDVLSPAQVTLVETQAIVIATIVLKRMPLIRVSPSFR